MGCYINPNGVRKEDWLEANAVTKSAIAPTWDGIPEGLFAVCLVNNVSFSAAGVAFDRRELEVFCSPDNRPRTWYIVAADKLRGVCSLDHWLELSSKTKRT